MGAHGGRDSYEEIYPRRARLRELRGENRGRGAARNRLGRRGDQLQHPVHLPSTGIRPASPKDHRSHRTWRQLVDGERRHAPTAVIGSFAHRKRCHTATVHAHGRRRSGEAPHRRDRGRRRPVCRGYRLLRSAASDALLHRRIRRLPPRLLARRQRGRRGRDSKPSPRRVFRRELPHDDRHRWEPSSSASSRKPSG